jgi:hypothetical protein
MNMDIANTTTDAMRTIVIEKAALSGALEVQSGSHWSVSHTATPRLNNSNVVSTSMSFL